MVRSKIEVEAKKQVKTRWIDFNSSWNYIPSSFWKKKKTLKKTNGFSIFSDWTYSNLEIPSRLGGLITSHFHLTTSLSVNDELSQPNVIQLEELV